MKSVRLIPFLCGAGGSIPGCEQGPAALQRFGLQDYLQQQGIDAIWQENPEELYKQKSKDQHDTLPPLGSDERRDIVLEHCAYIRDQVMTTLKENNLPVTIGGDHAMALGSIAGLAQAKKAHGRIGVLWVDAHADLNTFETSPSKALHGMPLAALLGLGDEEFVAIGGDKPVLKPEHIAYIGLRDVDPGETKRIDEMNIISYNMKDVVETGIETVFSAAIEKISPHVDHLFLSIDLDGFDPSEAPSVGTPVSDGFHRDTLFPVLKDLVQQYDFDVIEIAELNPTLPGAEQTMALTRDMLGVLLKAS